MDSASLQGVRLPDPEFVPIGVALELIGARVSLSVSQLRKLGIHRRLRETYVAKDTSGKYRGRRFHIDEVRRVENELTDEMKAGQW